MKYFINIIFLLASTLVSAQDTVMVMHYNLLNFGVFTDYCTANNNDPADKTAWLKVVVDYYLPDVMAVNEIAPSTYYQDVVLNDVLNTSGRDYFARAAGTNFAGSQIVNMLYYNSNKFGLAMQDVVGHYLRDMNVYKLFYKSNTLVNGGDTAFLYVFSAHLKAGQSGADKVTRGQMAGLIMDYIEANQITDACLVSGDFNLQNYLEQAWLNFTTGNQEVYRLSDPANMEGIWHNNPDFAGVHSQSTNINSNGCIAAGGMDDRFDFILINDTLKNENANIKYINGSYTTPGQDGQRFNGSLVNPPNNSAPQDVINAMFHLSDHLPVVLELEVQENNVLPDSWSYTPTMNTHIITIPVLSQPTLNEAPLPVGSYIGAFYLDQANEMCAGNILWDGVGDIALVAYGDDITTTNKDGFADGEPILLKVFSIEGNTDYYADADFEPGWSQNEGLFFTGGISVAIRIDAFYLQFHSIEIKNNWNAVSTFLIPKWRTIESVFGDKLNNVIFMYDGLQIFYPPAGIEELRLWNSQSSLIFKTSQSFTIDVEGIPVSNFTFNLFAGWNLISVPIPCFVAVEELNILPDGNIKAIKSIAGTKTFWPEKDIYTLPELIPGNAYYINVLQDCLLIFDRCD